MVDFTATLIQCTNAKRDEATVARDLYDESAYFRKMRSWADSRADPWFILSGKHGLLRQGDYVEPYDAKGLSEQQAEDVADELDSMGVDVIHICAGGSYTDELIPELERCGMDVIEHCTGMRIGERMQKLDEKINDT